MQIELKKIKHFPSMSEETDCFNAEIWIDGVKSLTVSNRGNGGGDNVYEIVKGARQKFEDYCRSLPPVKAYGTDLPMNSELYVGQLLQTWQYSKRLKSLLKKNIMVTVIGRPEVFSYKMAPLPSAILKLRERDADIDKVLNELPLDEAVKIFQAFHERSQ